MSVRVLIHRRRQRTLSSSRQFSKMFCTTKLPVSPRANLMPHSAKSFIDIFHDLRRRFGPAKLEKLLPDMASISMNYSLWNTTKKLMNHDSLVVFRDGIECFLDDVTAESIHGEVQSVTPNGFSNLDNLLRNSVFKAALNQEVAKAIDHQWIGLSSNCLNDVILLLSRTNLELLLQEYGSLLIIVAHNLINNILPVAVDGAVKKTTIIKGLGGWQVSLAFSSNSLQLLLVIAMESKV